MNRTEYLMHHGIKGQKWGVRNGPPYPLGSSVSTGKRLKKTSSGPTPSKKNTGKAGGAVKDIWDIMDGETKVSAAILGTITLAYAAAAAKRGADAVNANRRTKKYDKRIKSNEVDKSTKLPLKKKEYTANQDMKEVNPGYKNFNQDTKMNCMYCTTTYELRRRGYDVTAGRTAEGKSYDDVKKWFPNAKVEGVKGERLDDWCKKYVDVFKNDKGQETYKYNNEGEKQVLNAMRGLNKSLVTNTINDLKRQGNGARGNLMVTWFSGAGHSIVYEVVDNKVIFRDCQSNKILNPDKFLNYCLTAEFARLDNVNFDSKAVKECIRKR